jgi:acetyltransferase-like isoleucine patch superfamily enzyme
MLAGVKNSRLLFFIPTGLINMMRLYRSRIAHGLNVHIESPYVSPRAKIGYGVTVGDSSVIRESVVIGRHSFVGKNCQIVCAEIGLFSSIGNNVSIGAYEHIWPLCVNSSHLRKLLHVTTTPPEKAVIGNDVWIANNVIIMGGVSIGNGAIIGAGAVVTHDVPPYAIAVGNPAKVIRYRYASEVIDEILAAQWWNWTDEEICINREFFLKYPSRIK